MYFKKNGKVLYKCVYVAFAPASTTTHNVKENKVKSNNKNESIYCKLAKNKTEIKSWMEIMKAPKLTCQ